MVINGLVEVDKFEDKMTEIEVVEISITSNVEVTKKYIPPIIHRQEDPIHWDSDYGLDGGVYELADACSMVFKGLVGICLGLKELNKSTKVRPKYEHRT